MVPYSDRRPWGVADKLTKLTAWSRVLHGKLTRPEILKKFLVFYGNPKFIVVFTKTLCSTNSIFLSLSLHTYPHIYFSYISAILIPTYSTHDLPRGLFPPGLLDYDVVCIYYLTYACYTSCPSHIHAKITLVKNVNKRNSSSFADRLASIRANVNIITYCLTMLPFDKIV